MDKRGRVRLPQFTQTLIAMAKKKGKKAPANTPKSGKKSIKNYDPANSKPPTGGKKMNIAKEYSEGRQKTRNVS